MNNTETRTRRPIGFQISPEQDVQIPLSEEKPSIEFKLCPEFMAVIAEAFREWFEIENRGGYFNNNHDGKFLAKINAARLLYRKGCRS